MDSSKTGKLTCSKFEGKQKETQNGSKINYLVISFEHTLSYQREILPKFVNIFVLTGISKLFIDKYVHKLYQR